MLLYFATQRTHYTNFFTMFFHDAQYPNIHSGIGAPTATQYPKANHNIRSINDVI